MISLTHELIQILYHSITNPNVIKGGKYDLSVFLSTSLPVCNESWLVTVNLICLNPPIRLTISPKISQLK